MKTSYECGAKYFIIFDYYGENAGIYGTMQEEHFEALKSFCRDVVNNPQISHGSAADSVVVFPENYGWERGGRKLKFGEFSKPIVKQNKYGLRCKQRLKYMD